MQQHGTTTKRQVYVLSKGAASLLDFKYSSALEMYRKTVGRPAVIANILVGLYIDFKSKLVEEHS